MTTESITTTPDCEIVAVDKNEENLAILKNELTKMTL